MMDDTIGGLNLYSQPKQVLEPESPEVLQPVAEDYVEPPKTKTMETDYLEKSLSDYNKQRTLLNDQIQKMIQSYDLRQNKPTLDRELAAFGAEVADSPFFATGFSKGVARMADVRSEDEKRRLEDAKMRLELMKTGADLSKADVEFARTEKVKDLMGQLADAVSENNTDKIASINLQLAKLTGDPKFTEAIAGAKAKDIKRQAFSDIFATKTVTDDKGQTKQIMEFNPYKLTEYLKKSSDPAQLSKEIAETAKEFRKNRMFTGDLSGDPTPFDALAIMGSSPEIKAQAKHLAKQYQNGLLDEDKANTLAQQMLTTSVAHMDRASQLASTNLFRDIQMGFKQDALEEKKTKRAQEQLTAFNAAGDVKKKIEEIRVHPGRYSGLGSLDPRRVIPGRDKYDFDNKLSVIKSDLFLASIQNMRGLGALSDAEGRKVESAIAALNPGMSEKAFEAELNTIITYMDRAQENANRIASGQKPIFVDPKTGKEYEGEIPAQFGEKGFKSPKSSDSKAKESTSKVIRYNAQGERI